MTWILWLLAPFTAIVATAVITWFAGRPRRPVPLERALREHRSYLDDLADASDPAGSRVLRTPSTAGDRAAPSRRTDRR